MRTREWAETAVLACGLVMLSSAAAAQTNTFPSSGNVGIGTTSPGAQLQISGSQTGASATGLLLNTSLNAGSSTGMRSVSITPTTPASASALWMEGLLVNTPSIGSGSSITNYAGLYVDIASGATNNYAIYSAGGTNYLGGNVGIGTTNPGATLEVDGNVKLTSGSGASITFADGTVQNTAYTGASCGGGGDFAESVDVTGNRGRYEPGDVLVIDPKHPGEFLEAAQPYSKLVAGIYSTRPGYVGRRLTGPKGANEVPMAMVGIVPTKVTAENGSIHAGDLLVASSIPGRAMKGTDPSRLTGAVVGKALGNLNSGTGTIEVLVTLQ